MRLNVGELPRQDEPEIGEETREPGELLSRIYAHLAHRTPGVRAIEKRLEGTDAKSGIWSDILALGVQLFRMNDRSLADVITKIVRGAVDGSARKQQDDPMAGVQIDDDAIPEFRPVGHPAQDGQPAPEQETVILVPSPDQ